MNQNNKTKIPPSKIKAKGLKMGQVFLHSSHVFFYFL
jgi:hypothetical protein